ncbi:hypothetical protein ACFSC1_06060 [Paracoccus aurantiacus]|uniref:hypothetical protein n=1 Tax=Paracoccus aurantiacus TaxID=2599412 RepID=UPI00164AAA2E
MQRAALGCRIYGELYKPDSSTHEGAEVIAACVAGLPTSVGALRMAIRIAELARAGLTPDCMPGTVPRCVPVEMKRDQHGERSITIAVGTARIVSRGKWRTVELRDCPVTFSPHPDQIAAAHRHYEQSWPALGWVREGLRDGGMLRSIDVTDAMPKRAPWVPRKGCEQIGNKTVLTLVPLLTHESNIEDERPENRPASDALRKTSNPPPVMVPSGPHPYSGGTARKLASVSRFHRGIPLESGGFREVRVGEVDAGCCRGPH